MALPNLSHADLEKLKLFINFVSSNPTVLNMPQLDFVKQFIEKFGGKVPAGEFKMPGAGGKCPFGGDAAGADAGDVDGADIGGSKEASAEPETQEESEPESEVELDMEVETLYDCNEAASLRSYDSSMPDTNAVYFEELQIVSGDRTKSELECSLSSLNDDNYELHVEAVYDGDELVSDIEDPINTATKAGEDFESSMSDDNDDETFIAHSENEDEIETEDDYDDDDEIGIGTPQTKVKKSSKFKAKGRVVADKSKSVRKLRNTAKRKIDDSVEEDADQEAAVNESLAKAKRKGRPSKQHKQQHSRSGHRIATRRSGCALIEPRLEDRKRIKRPRPINCPPNCRHKCCEKLDDEQRRQLCNEFWQLGFVERKNYMLANVECRPLGRMRACSAKSLQRRRCTKNYYLRSSDEERVRVCVRFFLSTLCVSSGMLKEAIHKSDGRGKYLGVDKRGGSGDGRRSHMAALERANIEAVQCVLSAERAASAAEEANTAVVRRVAPFPPGKPLPPEVREIVEQLPPPKKQSDYKNRKPRITVRAPQPVKCAEQCQWKCANKFSEEQRAQLCTSFWSLDYKRRKDFVLSRIETRNVLSMTALEYRKTNRAMRTFTNRYFFRGPTGENVRVCAFFFMATLCIGRHFIDHAQKNSDRQTGTYIGEDRRGRHPPKNKTPVEVIDEVKRHIASYPTWVPHKNHKTRFLHSSLSIRRMYLEYKQQCETEQRKTVSFSYFTKVFHNDFRLAFLRPTSKHAHKVSPQKKIIDPNSKVLRIYKNVSEYTGEEGGFWTDADGATQRGHTIDTDGAHGAGNRATVQSNITTQPVIQHVPPSQVPSASNLYFASAPSYLPQQHVAGVDYDNQPYSTELQLL